jgi:hypothetical protein
MNQQVESVALATTQAILVREVRFHSQTRAKDDEKNEKSTH